MQSNLMRSSPEVSARLQALPDCSEAPMSGEESRARWRARRSVSRAAAGGLPVHRVKIHRVARPVMAPLLTQCIENRSDERSRRFGVARTERSRHRCSKSRERRRI